VKFADLVKFLKNILKNVQNWWKMMCFYDIGVTVSSSRNCVKDFKERIVIKCILLTALVSYHIMNSTSFTFEL